MFSGSDKLLKYDFRAGTGYWHFRSVRGVCGAALALSVSPIIFVGMVMFQMNTHMMLEFFLSLVFGSLGSLLCIGLWHLGKSLYGMSLRYIRYNLKLVTGRRHEKIIIGLIAVFAVGVIGAVISALPRILQR